MIEVHRGSWQFAKIKPEKQKTKKQAECRAEAMTSAKVSQSQYYFLRFQFTSCVQNCNDLLCVSIDNNGNSVCPKFPRYLVYWFFAVITWIFAN